VRAALVERFGEAILDDALQPDRRAIGRIVFGDREALAWLEALLHPRVVREYLAWRDGLAELPDPPVLCVTEVPLLYEVGGETRFDVVVVVTAPVDLRRGRARTSVDDREQRLLLDEEKARRADFVYENTGSLAELDAFVSDVVAKLTR
jgi:dephospho-CoA kinase